MAALEFNLQQMCLVAAWLMHRMLENQTKSERSRNCCSYNNTICGKYKQCNEFSEHLHQTNKSKEMKNQKRESIWKEKIVKKEYLKIFEDIFHISFLKRSKVSPKCESGGNHLCLLKVTLKCGLLKAINYFKIITNQYLYRSFHIWMW